jgi:hypothetical protein
MDLSVSSAGASSSAPPTTRGVPSAQPRPAANALLRSVECHVRLLQAPENVSVLRDKSQPFTQFEFCRSGGVGGPLSSNSKFQCTSLHSMTSNKDFFDNVVRPCIANAVGGQSYTFLVCGPPSSGRSQTLYGVAGRDPGMLELTARELLALGASTSDLSASVTTTYSSFVCMGTSIVDSPTQAEALVREFPPPLGTIALPTMTLLADPLAVANQPKLKITYAHSSSFTQFHVYRSLNTQELKNGGNSNGHPTNGACAKYAMAVITFIDLAAFSVPVPPDVQGLVSLVTSLVSGSSDVNFRQSKLTELLEQSLVGPTTLVAIGNVSAKPDLQEPAANMLRFLMKLAQLNQILMLLQLQVPKWVGDTGAAMCSLSQQQSVVVQRAYERGVADFFTVASGVAGRLSNAQGTFSEVVREAEDVRQDVRQQTAAQMHILQRSIDASHRDAEAKASVAKLGHDETARQIQELSALGDKICGLEQEIAQCDFKAEHRVAELRLHVDDLSSTTTSRRREREIYDQERQDHQGCAAEFEMSAAKFLDDMHFLQRRHSLSAESDALAAKKSRLEDDLNLASRSAHTSNEAHRLERERRSKVARVTLLEAKVHNIIEKKSSVAALDPLDGPPVVLRPSPLRKMPGAAALSSSSRPRSVLAASSPPPRLGGAVETSLF